jgi:hypothetical protein
MYVVTPYLLRKAREAGADPAGEDRRQTRKLPAGKA